MEAIMQPQIMITLLVGLAAGVAYLAVMFLGEYHAICKGRRERREELAAAVRRYEARLERVEIERKG